MHAKKRSASQKRNRSSRNCNRRTVMIFFLALLASRSPSELNKLEGLLFCPIAASGHHSTVVENHDDPRQLACCTCAVRARYSTARSAFTQHRTTPCRTVLARSCIEHCNIPCYHKTASWKRLPCENLYASIVLHNVEC